MRPEDMSANPIVRQHLQQDTSVRVNGAWRFLRKGRSCDVGVRALTNNQRNDVFVVNEVIDLELQEKTQKASGDKDSVS